jgi:hypothetical protein
MDRRALFFIGAAVVCAAVAPATESDLRWIPIVMAGAYAILALLSLLDAWSRHREHNT